MLERCVIGGYNVNFLPSVVVLVAGHATGARHIQSSAADLRIVSKGRKKCFWVRSTEPSAVSHSTENNLFCCWLVAAPIYTHLLDAWHYWQLGTINTSRIAYRMMLSSTDEFKLKFSAFCWRTQSISAVQMRLADFQGAHQKGCGRRHLGVHVSASDEAGDAVRSEVALDDAGSAAAAAAGLPDRQERLSRPLHARQRLLLLHQPPLHTLLRLLHSHLS